MCIRKKKKLLGWFGLDLFSHFGNCLSCCEVLLTVKMWSCSFKQVHMLPPLSYRWLSLPLFSLSPFACLYVSFCRSAFASFLLFLFFTHVFCPLPLPYLSPPPAAPGLSMVTCRHLYKSPRRGCRFLWPRPFGSLSLCLLEAVLARLEEQDSVCSGGEWPPCGLP